MQPKKLYSTITEGDLFETMNLGEAKELLGGKASGLFVMTQLGIPVPPAMTIPTVECIKFLSEAKEESVQTRLNFLVDEVLTAIKTDIVPQFGYTPLFSVRSGARVSMPGMMDTILNVGLTPDTLEEWFPRIGEWASWDSYRRLIQMMASVALEVPMSQFEEALTDAKKEENVTEDTALSVSALRKLVIRYKKLVKAHTGNDFPTTLRGQLLLAIKSVFQSWDNPRAHTYRALNNIPYDWGTAVTVQAMVFGNRNEQSCSGVLFTRDPSTGDDNLVGEFLPNAQGEDVVAGIRTPLPFDELEKWNPKVCSDLKAVAVRLEDHYRDMQDIEFTVENGKLYILQTRNAKRSPEAALRVAVDMYHDELITLSDVSRRLTPELLLGSDHVSIDPAYTGKPAGVGIPGGGTIVSGVAVYTSEEAIACKEPCILVSKETTPDDIGGMHAAVGILTATGGLTSHAAVVARGMGKTCVVGCGDLGKIGFVWKLGETLLPKNEWLTINGLTGEVWKGKVPLVTKGISPAAQQIISILTKGYSPLLLDGTFDSRLRLPSVCVTPAITSTNLRHAALQHDTVVINGTATVKQLHVEDDKVLSELFSIDIAARAEYQAIGAKLKQLHTLTAPDVAIYVTVPPDSGINVKDMPKFKTVPSANTITDILNSSGLVELPADTCKTLFEDQTGLQLFLDMAEMAGRKFNILPPAQTYTEFIHRVLGE
jgi:pyruvate,orthophosphate dikinase